MNKYALALLLGAVLLTSCNKGSKSSISRERDSDDIIIPSSSTTSEGGEPEVYTGPFVNELAEDKYSEFPINYLKRINQFKTYKAVTEGSTKTSMSFFDVTQVINVTAIKSEYSYLYNSSSSSFYSSQHDAYYHGDKVVYKNKGDSDFTVSTLEAYLDKYGTYPFETRIEGYKVTGDALSSVSKLENDGDNYRFKLSLDKEKSTTNVRIQMKEFGQLDDFPTFESIELTLTVKNDYTPVKIELDSKYKAKKMLDTDCHQTYTVTFTNFNETIEVPNLDSVKGLFN